MKKISVFTLALLLGLTACSSSVTDKTAESSDSAIKPIEVSMPEYPAELAKYYEQKITWEKCGAQDCTKIKVPLDYANPAGDSIEIVAKRNAAKNNAVGSLLLNPGGPGGSGQELAENAGFYFSQQITDNFDLIGFDPRGVGESSPVKCLDDAELGRALEASYADTPEGDAQSAADIEAIIAGCEEKSGKILPFVGTESAARDMDIMRHVFGDPRLYYVGFSYGTSLGGMYADLFPQNVGRMILDGAVAPLATNFDQSAAQLKGFENSLDAYLEDCLAGKDCPFSGTVAEARKVIAKMLTQALVTPYKVSAEGRELTQTGLLMGIVTALYDDMTWPILSKAFTDLMNDGDGSLFLALFDTYTSREGDKFTNNSTEANWAINCADYGAQGDETTWKEQEAKLVNEISPLFGPVMGYDEAMCAKWPYQPAKPVGAYKAVGSAPIVVVGTVGDPATPYEWAVEFAKTLDKAVLVTYEGEGHTAYGRSTECVSDPLDAYLLSGQVPKAISCPAK